MIVQYASDLHLEFPLNYQFVMSSGGIEPQGDVLLVAGDIAAIQDLKRFDDFWDWCAKHFRRTLFVPGNHDWYGAWLKPEAVFRPARIRIRQNVLCLNNSVERIDGVDFICSTLWSRIDPVHALTIERVLLDFKAIRFGKSLMTIKEFSQAFEASWAFVKQAAEASDAERIVVATHHVPSWAAVSPLHKDSPLTSGFATELGDWIAGSRVSNWIYGHSHTSVETLIGQTAVRSNQLGYISLGEGGDYETAKCFEIS